MNPLESIRFREIGLSDRRRLNASHRVKDLGVSIALRNLKCNNKDDHLTITVSPNDNIAYEDEELYSPVTSASFCKMPGREHILALSNEEGEVNVMDTNKSGDLTYLKCMRAHENAIYDMKWVPSENQVITVSGDETASLLDLERETKVRQFVGHQGSIKWVDFRPNDKAIFATAARDGAIHLWDSRSRCCADSTSKLPLSVIQKAHINVRDVGVARTKKFNYKNESHSVTAVLFQDEYTIVSSGAADRTIKMWDTRKSYSNAKRIPIPKYQFPYSGSSNRNGFSSLAFDSNRRYLFANCLDNIIYCYDCISLSPAPVYTYEGHANNSFYIRACVSSDDNYLLSGSGDDNAYIWKISEPGKPAFKLTGHSSEVPVVAWESSSLPKIITSGDDMKLKIWKVRMENLEDSDWEFKGTCVEMTQEKSHNRRCKQARTCIPDTPVSENKRSKISITLNTGNINHSAGNTSIMNWLTSPKTPVTNSENKAETLQSNDYVTPNRALTWPPQVLKKQMKEKESQANALTELTTTPKCSKSQENLSKKKTVVSKVLFGANAAASSSNNDMEFRSPLALVDVNVRVGSQDVPKKNSNVRTKKSGVSESPVSARKTVRVQRRKSLNSRKSKSPSNKAEKEAGTSKYGIKYYFSQTDKNN